MVLLRRSGRPLRCVLTAAAAVLLACRAGSLWSRLGADRVSSTDEAFVPAVNRRQLLRDGALGAAIAAGLVSPAGVLAFSAEDLGMGYSVQQAQFESNKESDPAKLKEALYLISRVQEATVQQERLVTTGKFKDVQRNSIKLAVDMMLDNYRLSDQIVTAAAFLPQDKIQRASSIGQEAVNFLETTKEYFSRDLKVNTLSDDQRKFIVDGMGAARNKLEDFVKLMPEDIVAAARKQVEDENELNLKEYVGADGGGIINPVQLPWKKAPKA